MKVKIRELENFLLRVFKYTTIDIDLSYLFSASKVPSPLENTLRFSLTFNFGANEYYEY